jgi:hypothetical protein
MAPQFPVMEQICQLLSMMLLIIDTLCIIAMGSSSKQAMIIIQDPF